MYIVCQCCYTLWELVLMSVISETNCVVSGVKFVLPDNLSFLVTG